MFEAFRGLLASLADGDAAFDPDDYRLAAAALMAHVAGADGATTPSESAGLRRVLSSGFGLSSADAEKLAEAGTRDDNEAVGFQDFIDRLNTALDADGRLRVVEMMYEIAYADGVLREVESDLIERVGEALPNLVADLVGQAAQRSEQPVSDSALNTT